MLSWLSADVIAVPLPLLLLLLQDEQQRPAVMTQAGGAAADAGEDAPGGEVSIKCARCYSLVHYG
jgi:hypothetical protein